MKVSFTSVWAALLLLVLCITTLTGCGSSPTPNTPQEQKKIDDEMQKAMKKNKGAR